MWLNSDRWRHQIAPLVLLPKKDNQSPHGFKNLVGLLLYYLYHPHTIRIQQQQHRGRGRGRDSHCTYYYCTLNSLYTHWHICFHNKTHQSDWKYGWITIRQQQQQLPQHIALAITTESNNNDNNNKKLPMVIAATRPDTKSTQFTIQPPFYDTNFPMLDVNNETISKILQELFTILIYIRIQYYRNK